VRRGGLAATGWAEERRAEDADVGNVVGMVEDVERVESDGECRDVLLVFAMLR